MKEGAARLLREQGVEILRTTVDLVPRQDLPPGWTCSEAKYADGELCDCDCGIWDPDCDEAKERLSVKVIWDNHTDDLQLLDAQQALEVRKRIDGKFNGNGFLDGQEIA